MTKQPKFPEGTPGQEGVNMGGPVSVPTPPELEPKQDSELSSAMPELPDLEDIPADQRAELLRKQSLSWRPVLEKIQEAAAWGRTLRLTKKETERLHDFITMQTKIILLLEAQQQALEEAAGNMYQALQEKDGGLWTPPQP